MKKIFVSLVIALCFTFTVASGCNSSNFNTSGTENGGQIEMQVITTLEGVWLSEVGKNGEHEKIIVEGSSIRYYIYEGLNHDYELMWAGIYVPFIEPVSDCEWIFTEDIEYYEQHYGEEWKHGIPGTPYPRTFKYSDGKLSCFMIDSRGYSRTIYFTKVEE